MQTRGGAIVNKFKRNNLFKYVVTVVVETALSFRKVPNVDNMLSVF